MASNTGFSNKINIFTAGSPGNMDRVGTDADFEGRQLCPSQDALRSPQRRNSGLSPISGPWEGMFVDSGTRPHASRVPTKSRREGHTEEGKGSGLSPRVDSAPL